jgi:type II secretory pathway component GspD/PulD (secretin)
MRRLAGFALVWLLALSVSAQVTQVYQTKARDPEELAPLVETVLGADGRVVADRRTNLLVLSGTRQDIATALKLLERLDVKPRSVRIRYEARTARELAARGVEVRWSAGGGGVRVGNVRWPGGRDGVALLAGERAATETSTLAGELRILEGQSGRIATGTSMPVPLRRVTETPRGRRVQEGTYYVTAESGFEARPRVLGDGRVELALRPFEASVRADGSVTGTGAETVVVLEPGRSTALGGILRQSSAQSRDALYAAGDSNGADETLLLVTADVE